MPMRNASKMLGQSSRASFSHQKEAKISYQYIPAMFWNVVLEKIRWTHRVRNEVLRVVKEERNTLHPIKERKAKLEWSHLA